MKNTRLKEIAAEIEAERKEAIDDLEYTIKNTEDDIEDYYTLIKENNETISELREKIDIMVFRSRDYGRKIVESTAEIEGLLEDLYDLQSMEPDPDAYYDAQREGC